MTTDKETDVFVWYAEDDRKIAERLCADLKAAGITLWTKDEDLLPGQNRDFAVRQAMKRCSFFLALLSKSISKRGDFQKELKAALDILNEFPPNQIFIIPVKTEPCEPAYEQLEKLYAVNLFPSYDDGLAKILKSLKSRLLDVSTTADSTPITTLHLSDIHLGTSETADKYRLQLETDLRDELQIGRLDYLVISGDTANKSEPEEYEAAVKLVSDLMNRFGLNPDRAVMVPGNHDLNWDISESAYDFIPKRKAPEKLPEGLYIPAGNTGILLRNDEAYAKRFDNFSSFFQKITGKPYPRNYAQQGMLFVSPDHHLLFLGLNSSWNLDHYFTNRSGINMQALTHALDRISGDYDGWLKIAVFHHPVTGREMMNDEFLQLLAVKGFQVCMHGHIHEAIEGYHKYDDKRGIYIIGAGTFGAPAKEQVTGIPLQYNLLKYYPEQSQIVVETRQRQKQDGAWRADARWGDKNDPKPRYTVQLKASAVKPIIRPKPKPSPQNDASLPPLCVPELHIARITDCCRYMDLDRLREKGTVIQVKLPEIFIPLYTNTPAWKQKAAKQKRGEDDELFEIRDPDRVQDIEDLMTENDSLLIEGEAGSGKTTLMKHFAYRVIQEKRKNGPHELLPVLIFLKDIKDRNYPTGSSGAEAILSDHLPSMKTETLRQYLTSGSVIILLDGLDEIQPDLRNRVVGSFADLKPAYKCKIILSGRPHGISGTVVDRFGDRHVKILRLNMEQINEFVRRWFRCVYDAESKIGEKTANDMIGAIKSHPNITNLTDNPLMLTAVCVLYHDGRELPGQRAELYKKFVLNLLYRRFDDPENIRYFLMELAYDMHTKRTRGTDRSEAVRILRTIYPIKDGETDIQYRQRTEALFDRIEPQSGLIKIENSQYIFRHLTFQEFFTAVNIINRETDYAAAIRNYWDDEWYKEVIELYIGSLSIEHRRWANRIVKEILDQEDQKPFYRWRLASAAFLDIHYSTREPEVTDLVRNRLISIFDTDAKPKDRAHAGEILGRLGDPRNLEEFIPVRGGEYELSERKVSVKPFELSKYPVTNQWYAKFIKDGGYRKPEYWSDDGKEWLKEAKAEHPKYWYAYQWNCPNAPVVVSFYEAEAFAQWLTLTANDGFAYRLPNEDEWEAAAAGFEKRKYPWGNSFDKNRCNSGESGIGTTSAVGIFKSGDTPEGLSDMGGNVWEWTSSLWSDIGSLRVFRGGSWSNDARSCRSAYRFDDAPVIRLDALGFRLLRERL